MYVKWSNFSNNNCEEEAKYNDVKSASISRSYFIQENYKLPSA